MLHRVKKRKDEGEGGSLLSIKFPELKAQGFSLSSHFSVEYQNLENYLDGLGY
jgi:hypothetical protein